jgi:hypothetical protein
MEQLFDYAAIHVDSLWPGGASHGYVILTLAFLCV